MSVEPDTLENWKAYSTDGHPILRNVQEALLNRDPVTNELVGELATAWEQTDDRTWRFTLRQGVTFHNGDPFNAEVAAFGINYTWSPENEFEIYQFIGPNMTATAVDEYTVDVATVEPDPILPVPPLLLADPEHDPGPGAAGHARAPSRSAPGPTPSSSGTAGQYIRITANPDWWGLTAEDAGGHGHDQGRRVRLPGRVDRCARPRSVAGEAQIGRFLAPEDCETTPNCVSVPPASRRSSCGSTPTTSR